MHLQRTIKLSSLACAAILGLTLTTAAPTASAQFLGIPGIEEPRLPSKFKTNPGSTRWTQQRMELERLRGEVIRLTVQLKKIHFANPRLQVARAEVIRAYREFYAVRDLALSELRNDQAYVQLAARAWTLREEIADLHERYAPGDWRIIEKANQRLWLRRELSQRETDVIENNEDVLRTRDDLVSAMAVYLRELREAARLVGADTQLQEARRSLQRSRGAISR